MLSKALVLQALGALAVVNLAAAAAVPNEKVAFGWYASWTDSLSRVPWKQYTHVAWSFAFVLSLSYSRPTLTYSYSETGPNPTGFLYADDPSYESNIDVFVKEAHKNVCSYDDSGSGQ